MNKAVLSIIAQRWRELFGFALVFRIIESLILAPAAAIVGKWLLGRTVLDSTEVVSFLLSPRGFLALLSAMVLALTVRLVEQAGLSAIFFGAFEGIRISSREALRLVWGHVLVLLNVSARFVGAGLVAVLPLVAVAGGFAAGLLPRHDVNYYLKLHPPEFITALVVIGLVALLTGAGVLALVVRWRWVVQTVIFEEKGAGEAFAESAALTRGLRWKLAAVVIGIWLVLAGLGFLASLVGDGCASLVLALVGRGALSLVISFAALLLMRVVVGTLFTFFGACIAAGVFTSLYRRRRLELGGKAALPAGYGTCQARTPRWMPAAVATGLLASAAGGAWLALDAIPLAQGITIHAHRGVSTRAPENTLAAVREAIAAGADYLETDVQLTKDGVLVVTHDNDFSRLGGVAKKVWDLTYEEIRAIPLGARSAPEFRNEFAPTFDALLAETRGRIKVNIELKYYGDHQPGLAQKVIDAVRARGMLDRVVIQCLEYNPLLEVRQLAPEVPVGYLLAFNARKPSRLEVNFLSVEQKRLDRAFIVGAHRRGQLVYAWTVNKREDMERLFDLGVDGVITDQSELARKTREEYFNRPKLERAARRVRVWLTD